MKLEIVAPLGKIYEGEVKEITLPVKMENLVFLMDMLH